MSGKPLLRRWWVRLLLALLVLGLVAFLARNFLVRKGLETAVTEVTGFPLHIDSFDLGILDSKVVVKGMRLSNPAGFDDARFLDIRRLEADVELRTAWEDELHIEALDLNIEDVFVVRNAAGETNLDRLEALTGGDKKDPAKKRKWRCDRLHIRLPRVVFVDFTSMRDGKPKETVYELGVNENFKNIRGPEEVMKIVVLKVIKGTPIRLARATVDTLTQGLGDIVSGTVEGIGGAVEGIGGAIGGIFGGEEKQEPPPPPKKPEKKK